MKACEATFTYACYLGNRRVHGSSKISVFADTWVGVIAKVLAEQEKIESVSRGVIVKIELKIGKYIKDTELETISNSQKSIAARFVNVDGSKSTKIRVPFVRTDITEDQLITVLQSMEPCLLLKDPAGTGVNLYDTNIFQAKSEYLWNKEPAGIVTSANVVDAGVDGMAGQELAEPILN
jgi:hypothetical protein